MRLVETFGEDWHLSGDWGLALETETETEPGKATGKAD